MVKNEATDAQERPAQPVEPIDLEAQVLSLQLSLALVEQRVIENLTRVIERIVQQRQGSSGGS